jgi:hypothetical protein
MRPPIRRIPALATPVVARIPVWLSTRVSIRLACAAAHALGGIRLRSQVGHTCVEQTCKGTGGFEIVADTTIRLWHVGCYGYSWEEAGSDKERYASYHFHVAQPGDRPPEG